jgi:hypothetical protein
MKRYAMWIFATLAVPATAGALFATPATAAVAAPKAPTASPVCHASVTNSRPNDNSTVYVDVSTVRNATVTAVAHYKTGPKTETGRASAQGTAKLAYSVGKAAPGYKVNVDVTVTSGTSHGTCSTSFTPR